MGKGPKELKEFFLFYNSWGEVLATLEDSLRLELYDAIYNYSTGKIQDFTLSSPVSKIAFSFIQQDIDRVKERYRIKRENGKKGGGQEGNQNASKQPKTTENDLKRPKTSKEKEKEKEKDKEKVKENKITEILSNDNIKNESNDSYARVEVIEDVGWEKFKDWLDRNTPSVTRMQQPFTREQYHAIKDKYSNREIIDLLQAMENYKPLTQKNKSAYLTFINWMNKRKENGNSTTKNTDTKRQELDDYARELACKLVGR